MEGRIDPYQFEPKPSTSARFAPDSTSEEGSQDEEKDEELESVDMLASQERPQW
jgi:hypothetical protein